MRLFIEENDDAVTVAVQWSDDGGREPQGRSTPFVRPLTPQDLADLQFYLEDYLELPSGPYAERGERVAATGLAACGEALFCAVFDHPDGGPERRNAYALLRDAAARGEPAHLAVASRDARFLALPWELLKAPEDREPIALDLSSFDRTLPQPARAFGFPDAVDGIRLLMVIARPDGVNDAPFQSIARRLFHHVGALGGRVKAEVLRPPSFAAFKRRLAEAREAGEPFHLVHFDGHGTFGTIAPDQGTFSPDWFFKTPAPQGYLCFETEGGTEPELVSAADFAAALRDGRTPCVVLNACRSGTLSGDGAADGVTSVGAEATVATRLIEEGVASVVAMTHSVYVVAASAFMAAFYERLFGGDTVSEALNRARRALRSGGNDLRPSLGGRRLPLQDWMVPVHYQRARLALPGLERRAVARPEDVMGGILAKAVQRAAQPSEAAVDDLAAEGGLFLGRDAEFYVLERAVRAARVCVIHGLGGAGKTELAKGFARWLRLSGGLDGPVFFDSFEPGRASFGLDQVVGTIFAALTAGRDDLRLGCDTAEKREALVVDVLVGSRCLLVWDNFETVASLPAEGSAPLAEPERARLASFLKRLAGGRTAVLITSRSPEPWLDAMPAAGGPAVPGPGDVVRIAVGGLARADGLAYADRLMAGDAAGLASRAADPAGFAALLDYLGGHPLSLRLALPHLARLAPAGVLAALRGQAAALPEGLGEGHLETLTASVMVSLRALPAADAERLYLLALLEDTASAGLLGSVAHLQSWPVAERGELAEGVAVPNLPARLSGLDMHGWASLLARAAAAGLLGSLGLGVYRLHPALPQTLAAAWLRTTGGAYGAERSAAEAVLLVGAGFYGRYISQQMSAKDIEAAYTLVSVERRGMEALLGLALGRDAWAAAQGLLQPLNAFYDAAGLSAAAAAWCDRAIAVVSRDGVPAFASAAGSLWRFAVGAEASRAIQWGDLNNAEAICVAVLAQATGSDTSEAQGVQAVISHQLGLVAQQRGDLVVAENFYQQSLILGKAIRDRRGVGQSQHQLGIVAHLRHNLDAAEAWYRQSLAALEEVGDRSGMAQSQHQLGMVAQERGDFDAAETWTRQSLALAKAMGDQSGMALSQYQLGVVAQHRDDLDAAEAWTRQSLATAEAINDRRSMALGQHLLGTIAQLRGDLDTAEAWTQQSLALAKTMGDRRGMALSQHHLGMVAQHRGDLDAAESWYKQSFTIMEAIGDSVGMAKSHAMLGKLAEKRGQIEMAFDHAVWAVVPFPDFPNRYSTAPFALALLTKDHGEIALAASWQRVTGATLPDTIRDGVQALIRQKDENSWE